MYAKIRKISKPIRKKDFYFPSGEAIAPNDLFPWYGIWQFKNIPIYGLMSLAEKGIILIRPRAEIKVELRKSIRRGQNVSSKSIHLASILEHDTGDKEKTRAFWNKVEVKFHTLGLSETEANAAREKIEAYVPKPEM